MFFLLIAKIIPPTSIVVPLISKYLLFTFIMNILCVLNTCIVINLYYQRISLDQVPEWMRCVLFRVLPRILLLNRKKKAVAAATRERIASLTSLHRNAIMLDKPKSKSAASTAVRRPSILTNNSNFNNIKKNVQFVASNPSISAPSRKIIENISFYSPGHVRKNPGQREIGKTFDFSNELLLVETKDSNNANRFLL